MNSPLLFLSLVGIVAAVLFLEKQPALSKIFHYLPAPFWCYFLPVSLASVHVLPLQSPVYTFLTTYGLGACLILLLLNVNLPAILRVGPMALGAMAIGTLGIGMGAVISYGLLAHRLPPDAWKGVGALSATWTGGSANMLAVKEALAMPDAAFAPFVIIDTVVTYAWMGLMIALAPYQVAWDRWVGADRRSLEDTLSRIKGPSPATDTPGTERWHWIWIIGFGLCLSAICIQASALFPKTSLIAPSGWAFILASVLGVALSFTPAAQLERYGASKVGYFCLYLLLAAIGARAQFQSILQTPILLMLALILVAVHALCLMAYGYWRRVPMFFLVTASQANIGGTASAPIVAGLYQPSLAAVGLLLAIAANVIGTYLGLLIAHVCQFCS